MAQTRRMKWLCAALLGLAACSSSPGTAEEAAPASVPPAPLSFALPTGPWALVSDNGSDELSVIDLTANVEVGRVPVGLSPLDVDGPHHLAIDRVHGVVYVALAYPAQAATGPHAAHGSSTTPGKVLRLSLASFEREEIGRVDDNPGDIVLSDDATRLVVTHFDLLKATENAGDLPAERATVALFGAPSLAAPTMITTCVAPHGIALSPGDGRYGYAACYGEDAIAVIDFADPTGTPELVPVGPSPGRPGAPNYGPYAAVASPDGSLVLVGDTEGKDLRVFDATTRTMRSAVYQMDGGVFFPVMAADGATIFTVSQVPDVLAKVTLGADGFSLVKQRGFSADECQLPHEARIVLGGRELLVVCEGDHVKDGTVVVIDPDTLATRAVIPVGVYPDRVEVANAP